MSSLNLISRRSFLDRGLRLSLLTAASTLVDIPLVTKLALAQGGLGRGGKKLLFIFLRGANDGLNSVIPVQDPAYYDYGTAASPKPTRPDIGIPRDPLARYDRNGACFDPTMFAAADGTARTSADATFNYDYAVPLGNGFAALHPALKFLAPVYNAGNLALVHRVGYPRQSRSHFDSQNYWETGVPNNHLAKDGLFYRTLLASGLTATSALTGISIQSGLPLSLRGSHAAMTNLSDPTRYSLLGIPQPAAEAKTVDFVNQMARLDAPDKLSREFLQLQYRNMTDTLAIFDQLDFSEAGNTYRDNIASDADTEWFHANGDEGYYLFPTSNAKNGGYQRPDKSTRTDKYVVPAGAESFFNNLKAAALILNNTDAVIAGTEFGGFDTHGNEGAVTGTHADLQKRIAWSMYALSRFFQIYGRNGAKAQPGARLSWNDLVIVTLSEFGRTTVQNSNEGTDHAEAGVMFIAGGAVRGAGASRDSAVFGCSPNDQVPWVPGPTGAMFGVEKRYLKRSVDFRSVLGEIIRDHLGASQDQLDRIMPGYADPTECLRQGGTQAKDGTAIMGELDLV